MVLFIVCFHYLFLFFSSNTPPPAVRSIPSVIHRIGVVSPVEGEPPFFPDATTPPFVRLLMSTVALPLPVPAVVASEVDPWLPPPEVDVEAEAVVPSDPCVPSEYTSA